MVVNIWQRRLAPFILLLCLGASAWAQDLYVSNKPFQGEVIKSSSGVEVELEPLLKALKLDLKAADGQITIGDRTVPVTTSPSGKSMVALNAFAAAAGLTVRKNADFGHTDVYASTKAPTGDWSDAADAPASSASGKPYTITVPSDYRMVNDPATLEAIAGMAAKNNNGLPAGAMNIEFVMVPNEGAAKTGIVMLIVLNLPGPIPAAQEATFGKLFAQGMAQKSGYPVTGPSPMSIGGQRFAKSSTKMNQDGKLCAMDVYSHLGAGNTKGYFLMTIDDDANSAKSGSHLRSIVDSFRLKK